MIESLKYIMDGIIYQLNWGSNHLPEVYIDDNHEFPKFCIFDSHFMQPIHNDWDDVLMV